MTSNIAMSGYESPATVSTMLSPPPDTPAMVPSVIAITPGYFDVMSTTLVGGRDFADTDRADTERVAIIDERLARRLWPDDDPLGKAIYRGDLGPFTVVGVVREVRYQGLTASIDAIGTAYFPHTQAPPLGRLRWLAIKSIVEPRAVISAVRAALLEIDPDLPLADIQTMSERTAHTLVAERLASDLATMFAAIALLLSMLGIYAVLASVVARRTREIGIRMALGSTVGRVFHMVLAEGAVVIGVGIALGLGGALAAARALDGLVHGVQPTDARILLLVAVATGSVALLACVAPARRAARINPVDVLAEP
jgi:hypothetical protein